MAQLTFSFNDRRTKKLLARFPRGVDDLNADSDEHEESDVSEEKEEAPPAEPLYDSGKFASIFFGI